MLEAKSAIVTSHMAMEHLQLLCCSSARPSLRARYMVKAIPLQLESCWGHIRESMADA